MRSIDYPAETFPGQTSGLEDNTHFNTFGVHEIALCVLKGITEQDMPLKKQIIHFPASYNPAKPTDPEDWAMPESPRYIIKKPR